LALRYWWGVSVGVVWRWRKALGVGRMDNPSSARLIQTAARKGADATKERDCSKEERQRASDQDFGRVNPGYHGERWTAEQLALLGTAPDAPIAQRIGKSRDAVRAQGVRRSKAKETLLTAPLGKP
jgi:hypothetical protein